MIWPASVRLASLLWKSVLENCGFQVHGRKSYQVITTEAPELICKREMKGNIIVTQKQ